MSAQPEILVHADASLLAKASISGRSTLEKSGATIDIRSLSAATRT